jgi:hypothetical protein
MKCDTDCFWSDFVAAGFMCVGLILFTLADSQVCIFVNLKNYLKFYNLFSSRKVELGAKAQGNFPSLHKIYVPIANEQDSGRYFCFALN